VVPTANNFPMSELLVNKKASEESPACNFWSRNLLVPIPVVYSGQALRGGVVAGNACIFTKKSSRTKMKKVAEMRVPR